jgi:hypothetical protein
MGINPSKSDGDRPSDSLIFSSLRLPPSKWCQQGFSFEGADNHPNGIFPDRWSRFRGAQAKSLTWVLARAFWLLKDPPVGPVWGAYFVTSKPVPKPQWQFTNNKRRVFEEKEIRFIIHQKKRTNLSNLCHPTSEGKVLTLWRRVQGLSLSTW